MLEINSKFRLIFLKIYFQKQILVHWNNPRQNNYAVSNSLLAYLQKKFKSAKHPRSRLSNINSRYFFLKDSCAWTSCTCKWPWYSSPLMNQNRVKIISSSLLDFNPLSSVFRCSFCGVVWTRHKARLWKESMNFPVIISVHLRAWNLRQIRCYFVVQFLLLRVLNRLL